MQLMLWGQQNSLKAAGGVQVPSEQELSFTYCHKMFTYLE